ncbi:conserved hypothetical protein [Xanthomonas citri pv. fuscans]|nr:conserved hypothetical protein [Xanthomonas citri pv. aurantifolii str. ICPB 10535]SON96383.1 conserved hypothetical protein [Xanthomonas citri pv. fuscans]SOO21610.1 conserved hypothetical protein [Xanthomonas citri pv. fuscans]
MVELVCSVCKKPALGLVTKPVNPSDQRHRKCDGATVVAQQRVVVQKSALAAQGSEKGAARKALTGRDHQGNHDSRTKPEVRGGPKGDRHDHGRRQNGSAGQN